MAGIIALGTGMALVLIGLWAALTNRNIIRIIVGFSVLDTGIHLVMIAIGYIKGGTAPIIGKNAVAGQVYVDPVPQALVLTAIVIGLGVTAFMLSYAVRMYRKRKSLDIRDYRDLKW